MKFELFYSKPFLAILSTVYKLETMPSLEGLCFPIFRSYLINRGIAFALPFNFYQTADYLLDNDVEIDWRSVKSFSNRHQLNFSLSSVGELSLENKQQVANNPVLGLNANIEVFSLYSKNHRQNIRNERNKAKNLGVLIKTAKTMMELHQFYDLMAYQSVRRHKMVFQPLSLFESFFQAGMADIFIATVNEQPIGGMFCLKDNEVYHYNWGVRVHYKNVNTGTLLIDYAINHALTNGYRYFDFGATPLSDYDLLSYKLKWGASNNVVYKYYTGKVVPEVDLNKSFALARKFFSFTPLFIAKRMMPLIVPLVVR